MTQQNAIFEQQQKFGATFLSFGPPDGQSVEMVESFGSFAAEYAAIRRHVAVLHEPQRGVLRFTGADRQDFLHRLLTQEVRKMAGGDTRRSFQLNDKGRIVADVMIHHGDADTWLEGDRHDLPALKTLLEGKLFIDDVQIEDWSDQRVAVSVMGPATLPLLQSLEMRDEHGLLEKPGTHHVITLAGKRVTAYRHEPCGVLGVRLLIPTEDAASLYESLVRAAGYEPETAAALANPQAAADAAASRRQGLRGRPVGWLAFNTARIEAGSPLFHIDFGPDSLPAETGLLSETVSFTKGCYLGQEIVARMHNLGHPKRVIVGLKMTDDRLPIAGAQVMEQGLKQGTVVGAVTSSTLSPLLGSVSIAIATMKWGFHNPGTQVTVAADGQLVAATVQGTRFMPE
jgi:tRNA-modifying protein YgfZ